MNSLPPFEVYFQEYVCRVQDEQLEAEISYVMRHNVLDTLTLERLMTVTAKELADTWIPQK